ncbi:MAG: ABC transporter permease [Candidatus Nomurabacteria bacterium]|jgi:ABC-2 type transport system permease protein|nr:ABC transporter permease [Candidatus Nomurabacteria bacterium]
MKNYFNPIIAFTKANLLRFFRDKIYIFFMLILPVMFLFIFGMIYSNNFSSFKAAIFNNSSSKLAITTVEAITSEDSVINEIAVSDRNDAEEKLIRGELDAIIEFPANFGNLNASNIPLGEISVTYSKNSEQAGQTITALLNSIATEYNNQLTGTIPAISIKSEALTREGLTNFDYVFAGLLGYTILTIGLMGIANILPGDKESGATKRLRATSITSGQLILSYALTFLLLGILSFIIMIAIGLFVFNFHMRGNWITFSIFTAISTFMMLGFGLAVGGWARTDAQASALVNIIMFPMMFLSGVFFPKFMMPEFVQGIMNFMPLTPIVDGIRLIVTENYSLIGVLPQLGIIAIWGLAIYALAIKSFRWE